MYDQKTDGGIMYRYTDINKCKIMNSKERLKHRAGWQQSIKEKKVCIEL
jgi:hypothetical protein